MRRNRPVLIAIAVALAAIYTSAQNPPPPQRPPSGNPDLNTVLMQCTFEIVGRTAQGQDMIGTAFVMGRPIPTTTAKGALVLITAAHVLSEMAADTAVLLLRQKRAENNWVLAPFSVPIRSGGKPLWMRHPNADVAVMYVRLPLEVTSWLPLLSTDLLAADQIVSKFEIHPGDELECLGYPLGNASNEAGFPILRSGKIASYPLLPTAATKTFLFDFRIFKGNSGGPVYFTAINRAYGGSTMLGQTIGFIAGLVSEERIFQQVTAGPYEQDTRQVQLGLAIIVHASLIKEAIERLPVPSE